MKKIIKLLVATGLALATTNMVFAQSYTATAGTIKDDVDYSMDTRYYKDGKVNDFLVNTSFGVNSGLDLTFAKQFSKMYLGTAYNGNFWGNNTVFNNAGTKTKTHNSKNNLELLIGVNNMPFATKLNFNFEFDFNSTNEKSIFGTGFEVGFFADASNFTVKPIVGFGYNSDSNKNTSDNSIATTTTYTGKLGVDFVFNEKDGFNSILGINYNLNLPITEATTGKIIGSKKKIKNAIYGYDNEFYIDTVNSLDISYRVTYTPNEKVDLGAKAKLVNEFNPYKAENSTGNVTNETFTYGIYGTVDFGLKYHVVPSFAINGGFEVNTPEFYWTSVKEGKVKTEKTAFNGTFATYIYSGLEWDLTKNFTIDSAMTLDLSTASFESMFQSLSIGLSYRK